MKLKVLEEVLKKSWSKESSVDENWSIDNPSLGECAVTALIVNLCCGGKIMRCMASTGSHYYNLIDGEIVDLTASQFGDEVPQYELGEERTKEYLLSNDNTLRRYELLLNSVRNNLIDIDIEGIGKDHRLNEYRKYFNDRVWFVDFEIFHYELKENIEAVYFDLASQNTGTVVHAKYNIDTDEYTHDSYLDIPEEFLKRIFEVAREYKYNLELEEKLTEEHSKIIVKRVKDYVNGQKV